MKNWIILSVIFAIGFGMLNGCGSDEDQQRKAEQARQDSLRKVREQRMEQQRKDSLARAQADSMANESSNRSSERSAQQEKRMDVSFDQDGAFTIQVEAWRSERKAQSQVDKWVNRGFDEAFVVQHGNEQSGNVWYRVRLGRLSSQQAAKQLQDRLKNNYGASSWISTAK